MAFEPIGTHTPTSIGTIVVTLKDPDGTPGDRTAMVTVKIADADGTERWDEHRDLVPHLSSEEITWLQDLLDGVRTKAQALLPA